MIDEIIKRVKRLTPSQQEEILNKLKAMQSREQREYKRKKIATDIDVADEDRLIQTNTLDLSASGAFISTKQKFATDKKVTVVLHIYGFENPLKLEGRIVRVDDQGIGIEFLKLNPYFKQMFDSAIWDK